MKHFGKILSWLGIVVYAVCAVLIVVSITPVGGWKALDVLTGSMRPTIQPGDLVIIHKVSLADVHAGNIVTYTNPNKPSETITHRVVKKQLDKGLLMVTTKGDANQTADPPFAGGHIVGRVTVIVPLAGRVINELHNKYVLAGLVIIPGLIVIFAELLRLQKALAKPRVPKAEPAVVKQQDESPPAPPPASPPPTTPPAAGPKPPPRRPVRSLDSLGPKTLVLVVLLATVALSVGSTYARTTTDKVKATGKVFVTTSSTTHPKTYTDCILNNGWKKFGFPDLTHCLLYVLQHNPPTFTPFPTPKPLPPLPSLPPIPPPPPIRFNAASSATTSPSPSPSPSPSATPSPSPSPAPNK